MPDEITFTKLTAFEAEGARVGLATCEECGAALLVDPRTGFDVFKRHADWHVLMEAL